MSLRWARLLLTVVAWPRAAPAQQVRELGVQVIVTASDPALAVAGAYAAVRPSTRFRLSLGAGAGTSDGNTAWRAELLAHFLLSPRARRGIGGYAAAGMAAVGGRRDEGYLVLLLGAETRPGATSGWFAEAGVGGGVRVAVGFRQRWMRRALR